MTTSADTPQDRHVNLAAGLAPAARRRPRPGPPTAAAPEAAPSAGQVVAPRDATDQAVQEPPAALPAPPLAVASPLVAVAPPAPAEEQPGAEARPARRARPHRKGRKGRKGRPALTLYAPPALKDELQARGKLPGKSQVIVLLDALNATGDRLHELLEAWHAVNRPAKTGRFTYPQPRVASPDGSENVNLRLSWDTMDDIDDFLFEIAESNRSLCLRIALETYFRETSTDGTPKPAEYPRTG